MTGPSTAPVGDEWKWHPDNLRLRPEHRTKRTTDTPKAAPQATTFLLYGQALRELNLAAPGAVALLLAIRGASGHGDAWVTVHPKMCQAAGISDTGRRRAFLALHDLGVAEIEFSDHAAHRVRLIEDAYGRPPIRRGMPIPLGRGPWIGGRLSMSTVKAANWAHRHGLATLLGIKGEADRLRYHTGHEAPAVAVTAAFGDSCGVPTQSRRAVVEALEAADLVSVKWSAKAAPRVILKSGVFHSSVKSRRVR